MTRFTRTTRRSSSPGIPAGVVGGICCLIVAWLFFGDIRREQASAPPAAVAVTQPVQPNEQIPRFTSYVIDMAGVIEPGAKARMADTLAVLYRNGGPQIVVATKAGLDGQSIAEESIRLARAWRIGRAGKNDGVLLLIAVDERKARIEVGYGLEGVLTDAITRIIIDRRMEAHLRAGEWTQAAQEGLNGILDTVGAKIVAPPETATESAAPAYPAQPEQQSFSHDLGQALGMALFGLVFLLIGLGVIQGIALAIPGVEKKLRASHRWGWIARWRILGSSGGSSGSSSSGGDSSWSSSSSSSDSSSSSSDSGGGGDFGGGGSND